MQRKIVLGNSESYEQQLNLSDFNSVSSDFESQNQDQEINLSDFNSVSSDFESQNQDLNQDLIFADHNCQENQNQKQEVCFENYFSVFLPQNYKRQLTDSEQNQVDLLLQHSNIKVKKLIADSKNFVDNQFKEQLSEILKKLYVQKCFKKYGGQQKACVRIQCNRTSKIPRQFCQKCKKQTRQVKSSIGSAQEEHLRIIGLFTCADYSPYDHFSTQIIGQNLWESALKQEIYVQIMMETQKRLIEQKY